jgi:hypothetical protein
MIAEDLLELEERYGAHNYQPLDVVLERREGVGVASHLPPNTGRIAREGRPRI